MPLCTSGYQFLFVLNRPPWSGAYQVLFQLNGGILNNGLNGKLVVKVLFHLNRPQWHIDYQVPFHLNFPQ